jgi:plastocyanin
MDIGELEHRKQHRPRGLRAMVVLACAGALVAVGAGCATSSASLAPTGSSDTLTPVKSGTVKISARDNSFNTEKITVSVGSKLVWTNDGRNDHNIVAVGETPFHVEATNFGPKATYEYVPQTPGTYRYYCSIHGTDSKGMPGTVQVVPN